ncbi:MAG: hypothetical protein RL701_90 [Pseudomonadota bacterium]|jgi:hypothetical protein
MLSRKPYLTVKIEAERVGFEVFVNGGFVATDLSAMANSEVWPINQLLRSGKNQLALLVYPQQLVPNGPLTYQPGAKVTVTVFVSESGVANAPEYEIATLCFDGASAGTNQVSARSSPAGDLNSLQAFAPVRHGDVTVGPAQLQQVDFDHKQLLTRELTLPLPFPEWAFLRSDRMVPTFELGEKGVLQHHAEVLPAYEAIWKALNARDLDKLLPLFEERSREIDLATYKAVGTTQAELRHDFEETLGDSTRSLAPLLHERSPYWSYEVGPMGTMVRLSTGVHGGGIIRFPKTGDRKSRTTFPISFRKQGAEFIVSR